MLARICATLCAAVFLLNAGNLTACPFCSAAQQTLSEEIEAADAALLVKLNNPEQANSTDDVVSSTGSIKKTDFKIEQILKGAGHLADKNVIQALHFGKSDPDTMFLVTGNISPDFSWATPIPLSKEAEKYIPQLLTLPAKGAERLVFFQNYLQNSDPVLSQDAYDEFSRAPYQEVKNLKPHMNHDKLVEWIRDPETSPSRRRLYFVMLGVCGQESDLKLLEEMMKSDDRKQKAGLDSLIACYLTLRGQQGLPLIEELFLKNDKAEYQDIYASIMAIRFHGQEGDRIPKSRLVTSLGYMLDNDELADIVIPDLARWQDWESMDRLVALFKNADTKKSWVRVPVVNYLQACAKQSEKYRDKANQALQELEKIDPNSVKRAKTFAAFGSLAQPKRKDKEAKTPEKKKQPKQ